MKCFNVPFKVLKNNKGNTLVELVISLLIFAIITLATNSIVIPIIRIINVAVSVGELNTMLSDITNELGSNINNATTITVSPDNGGSLLLKVGSSNLTYSVLKEIDPLTSLPSTDADALDILCIKNTGATAFRNVFDPEYYDDKSIEIKFYVIDPTASNLKGSEITDRTIVDSFIMNVKITQDGYERINRDYVYEPMGLGVISV